MAGVAVWCASPADRGPTTSNRGGMRTEMPLGDMKRLKTRNGIRKRDR